MTLYHTIDGNVESYNDRKRKHYKRYSRMWFAQYTRDELHEILMNTAIGLSEGYSREVFFLQGAVIKLEHAWKRGEFSCNRHEYTQYKQGVLPIAPCVLFRTKDNYPVLLMQRVDNCRKTYDDIFDGEQNNLQPFDGWQIGDIGHRTVIFDYGFVTIDQCYAWRGL